MRGLEILDAIAWSGDVHPDTIASIEAAILDLDRKVHGTNRRSYNTVTIQPLLDAFIKRHGSIRKAADAMGVSKSYLHDVDAGHRPPSDKVLAALGLIRSTKEIFIPA
jgi:hypothetical protein